MQRRNFLLGSAAVATTSLLLPLGQQAVAAPSPAGGLYYTADQPGRWAAKVESHLPQITAESTASGERKISVVTDHGQHGYKHYIVKHQLLDSDYRFIAETLFDPTQDEAMSHYLLPANYRGRLYALSLCNKHDLWLNMIEIT